MARAPMPSDAIGLTTLCRSINPRRDHVMRNPLIYLGAVVVFAIDTQAAPVPDLLSAEVLSRGPHERIWRQTHQITLPSGQVRQYAGTIVEIATGMHYWSENQWVESSVEIEL